MEDGAKQSVDWVGRTDTHAPVFSRKQCPVQESDITKKSGQTQQNPHPQKSPLPVSQRDSEGVTATRCPDIGGSNTSHLDNPCSRGGRQCSDYPVAKSGYNHLFASKNWEKWQNLCICKRRWRLNEINLQVYSLQAYNFSELSFHSCSANGMWVLTMVLTIPWLKLENPFPLSS